MISVSDSFKKAIKSDNREIHGYVEVKYQDNKYDTSITKIPTVLNIISKDGIINGSKAMQKYTTLENNYTLLDGSFMVWNENVIIENGYISQNIFEDITDKSIIIKNNSTNIPTKGVSIYFKENLPFDFIVEFKDTDGNVIIDNITNNESMTYRHTFNSDMYLSEITLNVLSVEFPQNRLRIAYIDFNLSDLYEGDELVNFDVTEQLDLLIEDLPINTCSVNINNYPDYNGGNKFDPINPQGIVKYLNDDVTIEPYIGVLTEENGIEYVPMGVFYLDDWSSNTDGNVTLNGKSVLSKLDGLSIKPQNNTFFTSGQTTQSLKETIQSTIDVDVDFLYYSSGWNNQLSKNTNLMEYLKHVLPQTLYYDNFTTEYQQYRKFYVNRKNQIVLNELNKNTRDSISRHELINDVEYTIKDVFKTIILKYKNYGIYSNFRTDTIINDTYTLQSNEDKVLYLVDKTLFGGSPSLTSSVTSGNAQASLFGNGLYMVCVKFTGTPGSVIDITIKCGISDETNKTREYTYTRNDITNGNVITIDTTNYCWYIGDAVQPAYSYLDKPYKVSANTMGDPSLEIGDIVSIQTRYQDTNDGYKNIIITKQQFTFDGGLQCSLEGVGD